MLAELPRLRWGPAAGSRAVEPRVPTEPQPSSRKACLCERLACTERVARTSSFRDGAPATALRRPAARAQKNRAGFAAPAVTGAVGRGSLLQGSDPDLDV